MSLERTFQNAALDEVIGQLLGIFDAANPDVRDRVIRDVKATKVWAVEAMASWAQEHPEAPMGGRL